MYMNALLGPTSVLTILTFGVLLHGVARCSAARVLMSLTNAMSTKSHSFSMATISEGLVNRGHNVTVLSGSNKGTFGFKRSSYNDNLTYQIPYTIQDTDSLQDKLTRATFRKRSALDYPALLPVAQEYFGVIGAGCQSLFANLSHLQWLQNQSYDAIVGIPFSHCDALLAEYLNITFIAFTVTFRYEAFNEDTFGIPAPSSYVPFPLLEALTDEMTFKERVYNFLYRFIFVKSILYLWTSPFREIQKEHGISPELSLDDMSGKAKLWLAHTNFALDFPRPTVPGWIPIGGLLAMPPLPLSQELESFVQGAGKHGVIIFSLGSMITSLMDDDLNEQFAEVFSELPQRVLWRYVGPKPRNLGDNTRVLEWLPQNDLLGHPQTRLLIYHGGINGVYEALYHKVPMVLLPIFADQPAIGARVTKKGMGVVLDRTKLTHDTIKDAIEEVLNNPKYKANVEHYGSIHHDALASPVDTAVFWIEHVLRFGGDHLRLRGRDLNFFVLNSFDVIAFGLIVALVMLYIDFLVLRACYRCCCRPTKRLKSKSD